MFVFISLLRVKAKGYPALIFDPQPEALQWLPFSDGKGGTVHLYFSKGKLIYIERNYTITE